MRSANSSEEEEEEPGLLLPHVQVAEEREGGEREVIIGMNERLQVFSMALLAIVYLISPADLFPEAVFGPIGYIDDIAILWYLYCWVKRVYNPREAREGN